MAKRRLGPTTNLYPMPVLLIAVRTGEGTTNIVTVAWAGIVGGEPPLLALDIAPTHFSMPFIDRERCFTANIPNAGQAVEADYCGVVSGRTDPDKAATCRFHLVPATKVSAPLIAECPLNLECRLLKRVETGSGSFLLAEIVETHVEESAVDSGGGIDALRLDPLVLAAEGHYHRLGPRVARAFHAGKALRARRPETGT
jgi:flavin reductase (DIM6/NTAB) family NADH-FMN oxidoreductase RutF